MTRPGIWRDEAHDFNDLLARVKRIELAMASSHTASLDPLLPSAPSDGQDFYYSLPNGGQWHFRFNERTGLWDFAGGPPLVSDVGDSEGTTSTSYADLTTDGPSLTMPFAGRYNFNAGANVFQSGTFYYWVIGLKIGSASEEEWIAIHPTTGASDNYFSPSRAGERDVGAAGDVCKLRYKTTGGTTVSFRYRFLHATPVYLVP